MMQTVLPRAIDELSAAGFISVAGARASGVLLLSYYHHIYGSTRGDVPCAMPLVKDMPGGKHSYPQI